MNEFIALVGISLESAIAIVVATSILYHLVGLVLRLWGPRATSGTSLAGIALMTLLGGIAARATLGHSPTLAGGLVAIVTLLVWESIVGFVGRFVPRRRRWQPARVVIAGAELIPDQMRSIGLSQSRLSSLLREAGVRHLDDVAAAILEPDGRLTVIPTGTTVDPRLLYGVRRVDLSPADVLGTDVP